MGNPVYYAQTFTVDAGQHPSGIFLSAMDVIVMRLEDTYPLNGAIYPITNGVPNINVIIPGSQVSIHPGMAHLVHVSQNPDINNPAMLTKFVFPAPLFLSPGDYSFVVSSVTSQWKVLVADTTQARLSDGGVVSIPPNIGTFYYGNNLGNWIPDFNKMLMFKAEQAIFVPTYTVNASTGGVSSNGDVIVLSTNDHTPPDTTVLYTSNTTGGTITPIVDNKVGANSLNVTITLTTNNPEVTPVVDAGRLVAIFQSFIINDGNLANNLIKITSGGSYPNATAIPTVTISAPQAADGVQATAVAVLNSANQVSNVVFTNIGSGYYETPNITFGVVTSATNAAANITGETSASGGNALARYITRKVTLADGFDATDLKVWALVNKQPGMDVQVYYKVMSSLDSNQNFSLRPWVRMDLDQNSQVYSLNDNDYVEYTWVANTSPTITYTGPLGYVYRNFKVFAIKICLFSDSSVNAPSVRDFRCIALA